MTDGFRFQIKTSLFNSILEILSEVYIEGTFYLSNEGLRINMMDRSQAYGFWINIDKLAMDYPPMDKEIEFTVPVKQMYLAIKTIKEEYIYIDVKESDLDIISSKTMLTWKLIDGKDVYRDYKDIISKQHYPIKTEIDLKELNNTLARCIAMSKDARLIAKDGILSIESKKDNRVASIVETIKEDLESDVFCTSKFNTSFSAALTKFAKVSDVVTLQIGENIPVIFHLKTEDIDIFLLIAPLVDIN